ncbi:hypothetical protein IH824_04470 [candidate division KSB1 bacterium]|nr:hypothetical protein [candidate division KSB1 bacterium]
MIAFLKLYLNHLWTVYLILLQSQLQLFQWDKIFDFLRTLKSKGESSNTFLSTVVCVLDDAYQNRLEGSDTSVNHSVIEKTARLNNNELESLIDCLARGIDYSYHSSHTGVKMACVRALNHTVKK